MQDWRSSCTVSCGHCQRSDCTGDAERTRKRADRSFRPVFTLEAQEERLFPPLALTMTYTVAAAAALSVTRVPVLMGHLDLRVALPAVPKRQRRSRTLADREFRSGFSGDSASLEVGGSATPHQKGPACGASLMRRDGLLPVSYTHLTLPTILLV